ncbi:ABC transporter substrate-binding protein [uncultured Sutterella sp.]|uniref:ABC transporter substrate-binding protein n=1 Tax=uncultured Sutterella sp. TaxID=286133 RepID=UPI0026079754|nr:ABC transporter substrate-binding protein [uncultured Sutterella sp.]
MHFPVSRKKTLLAKALLLNALLLTSLSAHALKLFDFQKEDAAALPPGVSSKVVTAAVGAGFTTLDPYNATDKLSRQVMKAFYEGFFRLNDKMEIEPALALDAVPSKNGLTWVIKLREGVRFSNGEIFDAHAAKANIDHLIHDPTRLGRSAMFGEIVRADATDLYELTIHLKKPLAPMKRRMAGGILSMVCPSALMNPGWNLALKPCGTGPYQLKSYNPAELLEVERRKDYWDAGWPKLSGIRFVPVPENHTRAAMLRTGEADFIFPMPYESADEINRQKNLFISRKPSTVMRFIAMNTMKKPLSDLRVREALNYAVSRDAIVKAAYRGYARPAGGVIPPSIPNALLIGSWPYDPEKAKALLKEAGYPDGFDVNLWCAYNDSASVKAVQVIQQQLALVGVRARITVLEAGERVARIHNVKRPEDSTLELYYSGWAASSDADWSLRPLYYGPSMPPVLFNTAYYRNPQVDKLIDEALSVSDEVESRKIYADIQERIRRDAPYVWLILEDTASAWRGELSGFTATSDGGLDFLRAQWLESK